MRRQVAEYESLNTLHPDYDRVQHTVDPEKGYPENTNSTESWPVKGRLILI